MTRDQVKRVVAYLRVSTAEQGNSGLGLEAQRAAIERECQHRGWELVRVYEEVASGKSKDKRPKLAEALSALAGKEADGLVVAKLDRLSRSVVDFGKILAESRGQGWALVALDLQVDTSTSTGKMVANVLMTVAEWERETIVERTKAALAAAKAKRKQLGRKSQVPAVVQHRIVAMRGQGMTFEAIASALTAEGVPTPTGKPWGWTSVSRIVRRHGEQPSHQRPGRRKSA